MWFSTGKPHPLASRPTLELTVPGASVYNVSDAEVIGDYILYWVGDPIVSRRNEKYAMHRVPYRMEGRLGDRCASVTSHLLPALPPAYPSFEPFARACTVRSCLCCETRSSC